MPRSDYTHKMVNGERVALTEAEIDECVAREEAHNAEAPNRAMASIRDERNRRLAETDYLALSDQTMSAAMTAYRQALRDVPANAVDPEAFVASWQAHLADDQQSDPWPTAPA